MRGGEGGNMVGEKRKKKKGRKKKEKSKAVLLLSSQPSIQRQQGRSTTVASCKAQKKTPDKRVLADGDQSGQEAGDSSNAGSKRPPR